MFISKKVLSFVGGVVFGTAGIKILSSKDARKVYVHTAAAALRAKECVMNTVSNIQEGATDILSEAQEINDIRKQEEEDAIIDDDKEVVESL